MRPQATSSDILSGSTICLSVRLFVRLYVHLTVRSSVGLLWFYFCLSGHPQGFLDSNKYTATLDPHTVNEYKYISIFGVQRRNAFIHSTTRYFLIWIRCLLFIICLIFWRCLPVIIRGPIACKWYKNSCQGLDAFQ